jgi:cytochrome c
MEFNKIAAAVLLAGLIGMVTGKVAGGLYDGGEPAAHHGDGHHEVARGYSIEVPEGGVDTSSAPKAEKKLPSILGLLPTADVAAGEAYFAKKCALCHTVDQGAPNKTGPNLWGIVNKPKGSAGGFGYSKAMAEKGGEWTYDNLNGFLHKPKKWLPGTIMAYAGTKKDDQRANLIAYLRTLSTSPAPIPAAPAIIEDVIEAVPAEAIELPAASSAE